MRRFTTYLIAVLVAGSAAVVAQKAQTPADLDTAMKKLMPANAAMNKAIKSMAWADAKETAGRRRGSARGCPQLLGRQEADDAVKMSTDAQAKAGALEDLLEKSSP